MEKWFKLAYKKAIIAFKNNDIPVGAVIVKDNILISTGYNNRQSKNNVLGHAEINAILKAQKKLNAWHLNDCDLYVTLRPCSMCEEIIKESRIGNVYYLSDKREEKRGYQQTNFTKIDNKIEAEYRNLLSSFFIDKR